MQRGRSGRASGARRGEILALGAGTGRITRQLTELGYRVVAVDQSAQMLARIEEVETVRADIETLDLGRRFDAVSWQAI